MIFIVVVCLASDTFARPILSVGIGQANNTLTLPGNGAANITATGAVSVFDGTPNGFTPVSATGSATVSASTPNAGGSGFSVSAGNLLTLAVK